MLLHFNIIFLSSKGDDSVQMLFIFCSLYKCLRGNLIMKEIIDSIDFICAI